MRSLIPTTEFNGAPDVYSRIKEALHVSVSRPYGRSLAVVEGYLKQFTTSQLDLFIDKLKTSKWVRNPNFSYQLMVRDDLVNAILTGGAVDVSAKYYNIVTLVLPDNKDSANGKDMQEVQHAED